MHKSLLLFCIISLETIPRNEITDIEVISSFNVPIYCQKTFEGIWRRSFYLHTLPLHPSFFPLFQEEEEEEECN